MSEPVAVGDKAPAFTLPAHPAGEIKLSAFAGRFVVLFFYPKDSTPGCTTESCDFRDAYAEFERHGAAVFGISRDSLKSHASFAAKHRLPFPLLADADEAVCKAYGVIKMKNMYGRQVRGIERSTFLIDPAGKIAAAWRKVRVKGHVEEVLNALKEKLAAQGKPSSMKTSCCDDDDAQK